MALRSDFEAVFPEEDVIEVDPRESTRSTIALVFLGSYVGILLLLILLTAIERISMDAVKDYLLAIGGPFGFIIGFYFKSEAE